MQLHVLGEVRRAVGILRSGRRGDRRGGVRQDLLTYGSHLRHFCDKCGGNTYGDSPNWGSIYNTEGTLKEGATAGVLTARIFGVHMRLADDLYLSGIAVRMMDGRNSW